MVDSQVVFQPSQKILAKYAAVLVRYALNGGVGVKPGEVVQCQVPDCAKSLGKALQNELLRAGAHPMMRLLPSGFDRDFYTLASEEQLKFFPEKFMQERVALIDHSITIIADEDPRELQNVDPQKIMMARDAKRAYRDWLTDKETKGKFTWTCGLWGVQAKADEVGLSLEDYWKQIIKACFLDKADPVAEWQRIHQIQETIKKDLNAMHIESVHIVGADVDLTVKLGADRIWQGGSGRNIPSFEFFTSPDWRGTEGWIRLNQPLYRYGNVVKDIYLEFAKGRVVKAKARVGNKLLQEMLKSPNADKLGEFSLTDRRLSRITHVMAETLFDENIGGRYGNTHVAIGMAYKDCYRGEADRLTREEWEEFGFNDSPEHTDVISTTDRTVTARLTSGEEIVLYRDGQFTCYTG